MDSSLIMQSYIGEKSVKIDFDEIDKTALKIFQVFDYKISDFSFCTEKNKKLNSKYLILISRPAVDKFNDLWYNKNG